MTYIKKLVMHGFKSFPRKTEVPFTQGINCILGPNGSGKSNVSDAICFVLGRLSIKSLRAAKASNLIFLGSKSAGPAKEAMVEIVFDNSKGSFSVKDKEVSIRRILRKNGQSIYKINNETKTRQDVLALLAQAGIDPKGFNIVLQGEIQNFVQMHPESRRGVIEEVSGISIYESRKQKSLHELEKTDERLKEIASVLRERTSYLNNLEKERKQALRFKKIQEDIKNFKGSIISYSLKEKEKELESLKKDIESKVKEAEKAKASIATFEAEIKNLRSRISEISSRMQDETGLEQEALNQEIANLRADLAGLHVRLENSESKLSELTRMKAQAKEQINSSESEIEQVRKSFSGSLTINKKAIESQVKEKKQALEQLEEKRKKFYMWKSELKSANSLASEKAEELQRLVSESGFLIKQTEQLAIEIYDKKATKEKLEALRVELAEKRESLKTLLSQEAQLEKRNSVNEAEIETHKSMLGKIEKLDICPVCKNKITPGHMKEIESEMLPRIREIESQITDSDKQLKDIYRRKEILERDIDHISTGINQADSDLAKLAKIEDKKQQIQSLHEKSERLKSDLNSLNMQRKRLESQISENSSLEMKYETLKIEIEEISLRSQENLDSEVSFKKRELERLRISLKEMSRSQADIEESLREIRKVIAGKESSLENKRKQEASLNERFNKLISEKEKLESGIRDKQDLISQAQSSMHLIEQRNNDLKIEQARVGAEAENLKSELLEFKGFELVKSSKQVLAERLAKAQEALSGIGSVNLRSLEVYDSIKAEYDSIKEKAEVIEKEKESILKIIKEIDIKKKKAFLETLKKVNELFSRNFSQLSIKGQVFLELENAKDPFEAGLNIVVKLGHGKYFDVKSLSGGEQTLVALSLIFAIQEYSPYYFYLLDEIDAALDKRNSERLAGLLTKYMQKGQYIVISHNDEIIGNATNLYGVSMHEGISKIISLKV